MSAHPAPTPPQKHLPGFLFLREIFLKVQRMWSTLYFFSCSKCLSNVQNLIQAPSQCFLIALQSKTKTTKELLDEVALFSKGRYIIYFFQKAGKIFLSEGWQDISFKTLPSLSTVSPKRSWDMGCKIRNPSQRKQKRDEKK